MFSCPYLAFLQVSHGNKVCTEIGLAKKNGLLYFWIFGNGCDF
jgi:hypothetical protein